MNTKLTFLFGLFFCVSCASTSTQQIMNDVDYSVMITDVQKNKKFDIQVKNGELLLHRVNNGEISKEDKRLFFKLRDRGLNPTQLLMPIDEFPIDLTLFGYSLSQTEVTPIKKVYESKEKDSKKYIVTLHSQPYGDGNQVDKITINYINVRSMKEVPEYVYYIYKRY